MAKRTTVSRKDAKPQRGAKGGSTGADEDAPTLISGGEPNLGKEGVSEKGNDRESQSRQYGREEVVPEPAEAGRCEEAYRGPSSQEIWFVLNRRLTGTTPQLPLLLSMI